MKTDYEKEFIHQFLLASRRFLGSRDSVFVMTTFEDKCQKVSPPRLTHFQPTGLWVWRGNLDAEQAAKHDVLSMLL